MRKGFTLIELLITISVITIISSALLLSNKQSEDNLRLKRAAFQLTQDIRYYQGLALSFPAENITCPNSSYKPCGFGLHFETNQNTYTLFTDCSQNCSASNYRLTGADDKINNAVSLGANIEICSLSSPQLDIVFVPPNPLVYLNSQKWTNSESYIILCLITNPNIKQKITINNTGKIEIE